MFRLSLLGRGLKGVVQCSVLTGESKPAGNSKTEPPKAQKVEEAMKETSNQETKKAWNISNLILYGVEIVILVVAMMLHPVYETKPVRALP